MIQKHAELGNLLLETAALFRFSEVVLSEILAAFRNFSRSLKASSFIANENLAILVNLSLNPPNQKVQALALDSLRVLQQIEELDRSISQIGGHEI